VECWIVMVCSMTRVSGGALHGQNSSTSGTVWQPPASSVPVMRAVKASQRSSPHGQSQVSVPHGEVLTWPWTKGQASPPCAASTLTRYVSDFVPPPQILVHCVGGVQSPLQCTGQ
jgi:hypothetical protein